MRKESELTPAQRLIVSVDFKPSVGNYSSLSEVEDRVYQLAHKLSKTGVCIKLNSVLRALGYGLIKDVQEMGLDVFADLKLNDIPETLATDALFLREFNPAFLTVMCSSGVSAMKAVKAELPHTQVLGVTALTTMKEEDSEMLFSCSTLEAVKRFAGVAKLANVDGLISSPLEVQMLRENFDLMFSLNTPAIRPSWAIVPGDDQNPDRIMTPAKAISAGADRIVVGRPIVLSKDPYAAVMRTIEEIASVTN